MKLAKRISELAIECQRAQKRSNAPGVLLDIVGLLLRMEAGVNSSKVEREALTRGLARVVTDDLSFADGRLGQKLCRLIEDFDAIE